MRFSEREGHTPVRDVIQLESVDEALRNRLWSLLKLHCWDKVSWSSGVYARRSLSMYGNEAHQTLCMRLWFTYFKEPLDTLDDDFDSVLPKLRSHFLESKWYVVYDFVEFVANNYEATGFKDGFTESCNRVLESEMSAYRFADGKIVQITDKSELEAIEDAISVSPGPVRTHLRRALELLSDRDNPDFRNSIKESISAIESLVASANGAPGTLGQLIKGLESEAPIHPALKSAFSNLYGYTSDQEGIRHAILESESIDFHDAKLMFVLCSAFVSFVTARISVDG